MGKPNPQNLVVNSELTPEERREKASKAGKASVVAKRKKKTLREMMEFGLEMSEKQEAYLSKMEEAGYDRNDINQGMVTVQGLIQRAKLGDVQAFNAIRDIIGEKPVEKHEVSGDILQKFQSVGKVLENDGIMPLSEDDIPE